MSPRSLRQSSEAHPMTRRWDAPFAWDTVTCAFIMLTIRNYASPRASADLRDRGGRSAGPGQPRRLSLRLARSAEGKPAPPSSINSRPPIRSVISWREPIRVHRAWRVVIAPDMRLSETYGSAVASALADRQAWRRRRHVNTGTDEPVGVRPLPADQSTSAPRAASLPRKSA